VVVIARTVLVSVGLYGAWHVHHLLARFDSSRLQADARLLSVVAGPAVLTNLATPVAAAFVTHSVATFGVSAVAGQATIERLTPVAFGLIYSLSGAVGPVFAQNLGAKRFDRVRDSLRASLVFMVVAPWPLAWLLLALLQGPLIRVFSLRRRGGGDGARLLQLDGGQFLLYGRPVCGQCRIQQPGAPPVVHRLQLGTRHAGHHARLPGGARSTARSKCWPGKPRGAIVWQPGAGNCLLADQCPGRTPVIGPKSMAIAIATDTPALDHLVIMASTLAQGVAWCEATLGVTPGPGGEHPLMGTHNRLAAAGHTRWLAMPPTWRSSLSIQQRLLQ
jgi:uncharacterized membrane protein YphA (DoxX/SURF4 family)